MGYVHLSIDDREVILKMRAQASSMLQIGDLLGRSAGTISRELSRNVVSGAAVRIAEVRFLVVV